MKRVLSTIVGGLPVTLDEIKLIQDSVKEITSGIGKGIAIGDQTVKVQGIDAVLTGSGGPSPTVNISSGLFWYFDELYLFDDVISLSLPPGMTDATFATTYKFDLLETETTTVTFNDSLSHEIHQTRKAVLTSTPGTWAGLTYGGALSYIDNIIDNFPSATDTIKGKIEFATPSEASALTLTNKAIAPSTLPITSETQEGLIEIATQTEIDARSNTIKAVTPATLPPIGDVIQTQTINIGNWNMYVTGGGSGVGQVVVDISSLGIDNSKIFNVSVWIISDISQTVPQNLETTNLSGIGGYIIWTRAIGSTDITVINNTGGRFDASTYDDNIINRGWITISYKL